MYNSSYNPNRCFGSSKPQRVLGPRCSALPSCELNREERDVPEHMMVEGFRWSIGTWVKLWWMGAMPEIFNELQTNSEVRRPMTSHMVSKA